MRKDEPGPMSPETPSERPSASGAEDPIASLFSADRTLPAPVVAPEVNESEMTRWKSARDSLFGDLVKDPPPSEPSLGPPPSRTGRTLGGDPTDDEPLKEKMPPAAKPGGNKLRDEGRTSDSGTPLVRALSVAKIGQQHEAGRDLTRPAGPRAEDAAALAPPTGLPKLDAPPLLSKKRTQLNAAPPPPAAGVAPPPPAAAKRGEPAGKKARPDAPPLGARTRKKTPPVRPEPAAEAGARKRLRRGPKPLLLAALGMLVLAAGGVSAVVLEIVPDPFAEPSQPVARGVAQPSQPAKPVAAAAPVMAQPAAQPVTTAAAPAASKPAASKPAAAAPKSTPAPQAQAAQAQAAQPKPAPIAAAAPDADADPSAGTDQLVALARKALAEENATGAEAFARRALAKAADDHHAMEVLARALIDQDRGPEAVTFARRAVEKRKKRVQYRLLLGDALLMTGDASGAHKEWQVAGALEPNNREVKQRLR